MCGNRAKQKRLRASGARRVRIARSSSRRWPPRSRSPAARPRWRPIRRGSAAWRCPRWSTADAEITIVASARAPTGAGVEIVIASAPRRRRPRMSRAAVSASPAGRCAPTISIGVDDRRRRALRGQPLFPDPLLARDAGGARRRSLAARRRRRAARTCRSKSAYGLQQAINGLPLTAVYALLAAAYSLVYGLVGRINLAFGALAAAGGYGAALGAALMVGARARGAARRSRCVYAVFVAATWGYAASRWVFLPLRRRDRPDRAGRDDRACAVPAGIAAPDAGRAARTGCARCSTRRSGSRAPATSSSPPRRTRWLAAALALAAGASR